MTRSERLLLIGAAFVAVIFVLFGGVALFLGNEELSPYDPTYYGIPDRIAGYETLAVFHAGNDRCTESGTMQVVTRAIDGETTPEREELQRFLRSLQMPDTDWHIREVDASFNARILIQETETRFENGGACPDTNE